MKFLLKLIFISILLNPKLFGQSQIFEMEGSKYEYKRPSTFDFLLNSPATFIEFGKQSVKKEYIPINLAILASTGVLIVADQSLYNAMSKFGRDVGIGNGDNTKTMLSIGKLPIFRGPTDVGSAMYFIGDGWFHLGFSLGFLTAGLINDDNRALQTASQIAQGMVTCGISTQLLKHITGRETPIKATQSGGVWRFFPNQTKYHKNVPKYDAYPSGHVATAMMTLTVIAKNYEEYKWIRPVGYSLIALLSYQMVNNGVHWMSDYPLALGMGYLFGKVIVDAGRTKIGSNGKVKREKFTVSPYFDIGKTYGFNINYSF